MPGIKRNVVFLGLSQGVGIAGELVMVAMTARYLGVERFGQQSVLRATAMFALPLFAGGLNIHIVRAIARDPEGVPTYLGNILTLRWALGLGAGLTAALIVHLLPMSASLEIASYAAILLALSGIWVSVPRAILIAYERNEYNLVMGGVISVFSIALMVVAIRMDTGVAGTIMAVAIATFLVASAAQLMVWRYLVKPRLACDLARWREILGSMLPLGVGGVLRRSYTRIDVWLLAALAGSGAAALFSVAYRVALQATDVSRLLATALLPRVSLLAKSRLEDLRAVVEGLLRLLLVISIAGAGLAAACAAPLLMLIVGPAFRGSVEALRLVSVVCVTALPSAVLFLVLVALGRERIAVLTMAVTVVWNGLIDALLIPSLGVRGACYGTISAEWVYFAITLYLVQRDLKVPGMWPLFGRLVVSGLAMAVVIWIAGADRPALGAIAGLAAFAALGLFLRIIPRGTVRKLRRALAVRPDQASAEAGALTESTPAVD